MLAHTSRRWREAPDEDGVGGALVEGTIEVHGVVVEGILRDTPQEEASGQGEVVSADLSHHVGLPHFNHAVVQHEAGVGGEELQWVSGKSGLHLHRYHPKMTAKNGKRVNFTMAGGDL